MTPVTPFRSVCLQPPSPLPPVPFSNPGHALGGLSSQDNVLTHIKEHGTLPDFSHLEPLRESTRRALLQARTHLWQDSGDATVQAGGAPGEVPGAATDSEMDEDESSDDSVAEAEGELFMDVESDGDDEDEGEATAATQYAPQDAEDHDMEMVDE